MNKLAVIGPGLLGGSIALAAQRQAGLRMAIWARRPEAVAELQARGLGDEASTNLAAVAEGADFLVLCVPIGAMAGLARTLAEVIPAGAVITDVGSVKGPVVAELTPLLQGRGTFVGSHPMAGSEQTGLAAARADLFTGSICILTPEADTPPPALAEVRAFWQGLGCQVRELSPARHDETVGLISHAPHLLAAALVNAVAARDAEAFGFTGPGFRDLTRIAGGPPEMWAEILGTNRLALRSSVEAVIEKLREFITLLDRPTPEAHRSMNEFLAQAKAHRDLLPPRP